MKVLFRNTKSFGCISWQKALILMIFVGSITCNSFGQAADYSESDYGTLITNRNDPYPGTNLDKKIIPCRKLNKPEEVFGLSPYVQDISQARLKTFNELTNVEKEEIITYVWNRRDTALLPVVIKLAQDTLPDQKYVRMLSIECLSRFNTVEVKKVLTDLLKDNEVGIISAVSLVQLGQTEKAFQYIQTHYSESISYSIVPEIVTVLMMINTPEATELLKKIAEHQDPGIALDALAALSIMGYCDFAYEGFRKYINNEVGLVRTKVAACLLYYIGSPEAINDVKNLYDEEKDQNMKVELGYIKQRFIFE